ncbi:MAG: hypothetical protein FWE62_00770 [Firmicutes bacterium]|nr:hypothetical protein [Bacillota bacterium]
MIGLKRIMLFCMVLVMAFSAFACGEGGGGGSQTASPEGAPDYSASTKALNMYAHVVPTDGRYTTLGSGIVKNSGDHRTVARYQEYKDCGFDTLVYLAMDTFNGDYGTYYGEQLPDDVWPSVFDNRKYLRMDWADCDVHRNMDKAQEVGLKVIVFDAIIHNMSVVQGGLIGPGKPFADEDALDDFMWNELLKDKYIDHPAFYGITLRDEPFWVHLQSYGEVYKSLKRLIPDIYIPLSILSLVLTPSAENAYKELYAGPHRNQFANVREAYEFYVDTFLSFCPDFGLSYYPSGRNASGGQMFSSYGLSNLQYINKKTAEKGGHFLTIMQTFATTGLAYEVNESLVRYNTNSALSFGSKNLVYFTYWMFPFKDVEGFTQGIMDDFGNKMLYDEVQRVNSELKKTAKIVLNYEYEKTYTAWLGAFGPELAGRLEEVDEPDELEDIVDFKVTNMALINQMYDKEKDIYGYYVVNLSNPYVAKKDNMTITFDTKYKAAMVCNKGEVKYLKLDKSKLTLTLDEGDSAFVIPY